MTNRSAYLDSLPGGVTFSGGECMMQMKELEPLLQRLNACGADDPNHIHTVVETSLFCSLDQLNIALKYIDLFYVDIKILDEKKCTDVLGSSLDIYKTNLMTLLSSGKQTVFRVPVIGGYTDGEENRRAVVELIKYSAGRYTNVLKVEILKEHNLGMNKYQSLTDGGSSWLASGEVGASLPDYKGVDESLMYLYKEEIENGLQEIDCRMVVEICKI